MKIYKSISLIILLLLTGGLYLLGVAGDQSIMSVFTANSSSFVQLIIIFILCLAVAPALGALISRSGKFAKGFIYLLAGLAASGAALLMLYTIKFAIGADVAVAIAVFISALVISVVFITDSSEVYKATIDRLEERGVKAATIRHRTAIKNAYALFFENSGRIASVITALYLVGDIMVSGGGLGCYFVNSAEMLLCAVFMLMILAAVALLGNLMAMWIER